MSQIERDRYPDLAHAGFGAERKRLDPFLVLRLDGDEALGFSGENIGKVISLLKEGAPLKGSRWGKEWQAVGPEDDFDLPLVLLSEHPDITRRNSQLRERLYDAEAQLQKHADLIKGAEALEVQENSDQEKTDGC